MFGRKTRDFAADYAADKPSEAVYENGSPVLRPAHSTAGAPSDQRPARSAEVAVLERPAPPRGPTKPLAAIDMPKIGVESIADYRSTAEAIGLNPQDIVVEEFRHFLAGKDIPSFNLHAVVSYMDELVAKDNPTGLGWHWCPVRPKDSEVVMAWGRASRHETSRYMGNNQSTPEVKTPASDFYQSHNFHRDQGGWSGGMFFIGNGGSGSVQQHVPTTAEVMQSEIDGKFHRHAEIRAFWNTPSPAYTRTLPLHALKKIALIEKEFARRVVFLVTEYTTTPDVVINPDPFLMAVIPNGAVSHGKGRFIIDVWDEPGFGIAQMLK